MKDYYLDFNLAKPFEGMLHVTCFNLPMTKLLFIVVIFLIFWVITKVK